MIRDRIVAGVLDSSLSEKMQLDSQLTLVLHTVYLYVYDLMVVILINSYGYYCKQKPYCVCYISPYFV